MKLISAKPSPFARKVSVALYEKSLKFEEFFDLPWMEDPLVESYNPLGKIPVLINDEGDCYYDSRTILLYLETLNVKPALLPHSLSKRLKVQQFECLADGIADAVVLIAMENCRTPAKRSESWILRQEIKIERGIAELDRLITKVDWLVHADITIADISVGCVLGYLAFRMPKNNWKTKYPILADFSYFMEQRESFQSTTPAPQELPIIN